MNAPGRHQLHPESVTIQATGWREDRYIIQAVVTSKAIYYLNVTPLTDTELDALDRRIALQFKWKLHIAKSTSSHILYMP